MKTDIEISNETKLLPIMEVANMLEIDPSFVEPYGHYMAKLDLAIMEEEKKRENGHLILVTSINPTPFGEGKTTMSIGIDDALCKLGKNSIVVLREPSLGPVFGIKGGATGGGYSQVAPMENINLHFTGDMHAITSANNLLCAALDNHLFQGNELNIDPNTIVFPRALDMNDRSLRHITIGEGKNSGIERKDSFVITVATEIMAILCLAENLEDLKEKLGNILVAYTYDEKPIYARDLKVAGAMTVLLKDAIKPNLVQTLEHHPAILHGGPFANIAHGCNSIIATKLGLKLGDYVVTEAGFGADLGAEKFFDIKCRKAGLKPDVVVVNATIRSLKYNGHMPKEDLKTPSVDYLKAGMDNIRVHIENMKKYSNHVIVCINQFHTDSEEEIKALKEYVRGLGVPCEVSETFRKGGEGATSLAKEIIKLCEEPSQFQLLYEDQLSITDKIALLAHEIYRAEDVHYEEEALKSLRKIEEMGYSHLPICVAKTQYSLSDDPKKIGEVSGYSLTVRDLKVCSGAGFIVVYMGSIMTMPGLGKNPAYLHMNIDQNGIITGLF